MKKSFAFPCESWERGNQIVRGFAFLFADCRKDLKQLAKGRRGEEKPLLAFGVYEDKISVKNIRNKGE